MSLQSNVSALDPFDDPDGAQHLLKGKLLFPFIAPPSGGKGTQTNRLCRRLGIPKLDMGGMLRAIATERDNDLARHIRDRQANGQLVDTDVVIRVLKGGLAQLVLENPQLQGVILDGFPRNREQADGLLEMCETSGTIVARAFYLKVPHEVILERAINRRLCPVCNKIYNLLTKPPVNNPELCDVEGARLVRRPDDDPDKVKNRLISFEEETRPMIARFREDGKLSKIDGNRPVDEITEQILAEMRSLIPSQAGP